MILRSEGGAGFGLERLFYFALESWGDVEGVGHSGVGKKESECYM